MKRLVSMAALLLGGCTTGIASDSLPRLTPAELAAAPTVWHAREVEVTGLIAWEFENVGLWENYESYCRHAEKSAITVDWDEWAGVTQADTRRLVTIRGTFRNIVHVKQPDGTIIISTGAPGPGPLEPGVVVKWRSQQLPNCR